MIGVDADFMSRIQNLVITSSRGFFQGLDALSSLKWIVWPCEAEDQNENVLSCDSIYDMARARPGRGSDVVESFADLYREGFSVSRIEKQFPDHDHDYAVPCPYCIFKGLYNIGGPVRNFFGIAVRRFQRCKPGAKDGFRYLMDLPTMPERRAEVERLFYEKFQLRWANLCRTFHADSCWKHGYCSIAKGLR